MNDCLVDAVAYAGPNGDGLGECLASSGARVPRWSAMPRCCDGERALPHARRPEHWAAHTRGLERSRKSGWKHGHYSANAKRVRRDARQQYRLLPQLIAADNEDDVLDLISSL